MRTWVSLSLALVVGLATVGSAWAISCPTLVKAANEAIAAAEPKAGMGDDRQKTRSKEAEASHGAGKHGLSEAQAKAAEQVK
jgi:hypothetical protein